VINLGEGEKNMKKIDLIALVLTVLMLIPIISTALAAQPPIVSDTLYVGTIGWGPRRADSARAYDTGSGELILNSYDTLIFENGELYWDFVPWLATNVPTREDVTKTVTSTDVSLTDPTGSHWSDGSRCIGWVDNHVTGNLDAGDVVYLVEPDGSYRTWFVQAFSAGPPVSVTLWRGRYVFHIRTVGADGTSIKFFNETGGVEDTFEVADAEYSLKRGIVQDQIGSPQWMLYKALFDTMNSGPFASNTTEPTAMSFAHMVNNAIEVSGSDLIINVGIPFPDVSFKQVLSQTWGAIVSKEFSISIGCWNGDLFTDSIGYGYPDWWDKPVPGYKTSGGLDATVRRGYRSPYDATAAIPGRTAFTNGYRYVGTGPYHVSQLDSVNLVVALDRNPGCWLFATPTSPFPGFPPAVPPAKSFLDHIIIHYIDSDSVREASFASGDLDVCAIPRADLWIICDPTTGEPKVATEKTIKNISPSLSMDACHFTFTVDPSSTYIGTGSLSGGLGVPPDFFNNTHVRKAFAYSFNTTGYLKDAWQGEGVYRKNPLIYGLAPDYYNNSVPGYDINYALAEQELKAATFGGVSVWDSGFTLTLAFNTGNTQRYIECLMTQAFFNLLSTYDGRTGNPFVVTIKEIDWPTYLDLFETYMLPIWDIGWLADFADADNFMRPYMHSDGDFAYFQNYTADNGWGSHKDELIDAAIKTPDGSARAAIYQELQMIYYNDCPSFPIVVPTGRRFCQYWVRGWYYDALYPAQYYASMWKENTCWFDISGSTPGVSDGACNMRDITYLILHFNAKAPAPAKPVDPKWVGTYGCGGVDPYGDRVCNMRDITWCILHFNHHAQP